MSPSATDVLDLRAADLRGADIALAGPPCQGFSALKGRDGIDPRNELIVHTARLIAEASVPAFIIENVVGVKWRAKGKFLERVLDAFRGGNQTCKAIEVDCAKLGLPQRRRRILLVGGVGSLGTALIRAVEALAAESRPRTAVKDVLLPQRTLKGLPNHAPRSYRAKWYGDVIENLAPGQKLCDTRLGPSSLHSWDLPGVFGVTSSTERILLLALVRLRRREEARRYAHVGDGRPVTLRQLAIGTSSTSQKAEKSLNRLMKLGYVVSPRAGYYDLARKFNGRFKRLPLTGPSPAVLKEFGFARNILHPSAPRALTVRECARLQGFPDDFEFHGSLSDQYQLVANAFPPQISQLVADVCLPALTQTPRAK